MLACEDIVSCEWYQTPADAEFFIQHPTLNRAAQHWLSAKCWI
jgi:hypothetical protein